jgi:hypothetical protein|tara:strand:- start:1293 stop:1475 length:183 start_codon:yes stop_codon:yes gene_type:complete
VNEEQQLTDYYADTLMNVAVAIKQNNKIEKKEIIIKLIKSMTKASENIIKLLDFDERFLA